VPELTIVHSIELVDHVGVLPTFNESVGLSDQLKIILPKISLPDEVVYALKNSKAMNYWPLMQAMSIEVQKIRRVNAGDYVLSEDINQPKKAVVAVLDYVDEALRWEGSSVRDDVSSLRYDAYGELYMVPEARAGEIYDVEWHNALVRAIKKVVDIARKWFPLRLGPEAKSLLREKKPEDLIEPDDHNNKRDVLENAVNTLMQLGGFIVVLMRQPGGGR